MLAQVGATGGRPCKKPTHASGRPSSSCSLSDVANDDESDDELASKDEWVECGDDEVLEAEGPVLDDFRKGDAYFVYVFLLRGKLVMACKKSLQIHLRFFPLSMVARDLIWIICLVNFMSFTYF